LRILKEKGDLIFNEEMEELQEPFNAGEAPEPTSEEMPADEGAMPEEGLEADLDIDADIEIEEEPVGIDPAESFFPPNEDYDYAPDVMLTGNPNDGIKYPSGSEKVDDEQIVPIEVEEGELGIQEKTLKKQKEMAWRDNNTQKLFVNYDVLRKELEVGESDDQGRRSPNVSKYQNINWSTADFNEFQAEFGGTADKGASMAILTKDPRPELEKAFGKASNFEEGKESSMKILTQKEAMDEMRKNVLNAKKIMKEFDFNVPAETEPEYDIENPPVEGEMDADIDVDIDVDPETEPKDEGELILDILADAEELYKKVVGEDMADEDEIAVDEEMLSDEVDLEATEDEQVPSIDMLEAKKAARARIKEKVSARKKAKRIAALKSKIKESMKPGLDDNELDASAEDLKSEDEGLMDTLYAEKKASAKKALKAKIKEKGDNVEFTKNNPDAPKPTGMTVPASDNSTSSDNGKGNVKYPTITTDAPDPTTNMVNVPANKEAEGWDDGPADAFFEDAKKRSIERKAYLKAILNEEDTPIMSDQSDVEELMGLKIMKKMGEDPKLVESKVDKFVENYKGKKAFNFKDLLNNGFLG